jgi:hypothetical protein
LYKVSYDIRFNGDLLYSSELLVEAEDGSGDDYSICGRTFDDKNRNNEQDPDDSVLNGVSVALYDEKGSIVRGPFETFKGGNYAFRGLRAGSYYVEFDVPVSHAEFVVANRGGNTRWDSDVIDAGVTRIINLPIDSNQGEKKTATCTVNWIDAGFR